ncbi:hypothetical protein K505DRAFT_338557 [Melanomma pulvis-pyrius CBS 109.77]|uniref:Uncharacterized protein n=1 Tax=Melanomma pulvis-pyrius CBS 109.77 TaxID=1314802 RepID=A0A6A6X8F0_9PLEO|nr:hypothetical protein K505DRAFT_338557 [Melanomma pulvis-pyrius CBS 109.77]
MSGDLMRLPRATAKDPLTQSMPSCHDSERHSTFGSEAFGPSEPRHHNSGVTDSGSNHRSTSNGLHSQLGTQNGAALNASGGSTRGWSLQNLIPGIRSMESSDRLREFNPKSASEKDRAELEGLAFQKAYATATGAGASLKLTPVSTIRGDEIDVLIYKHASATGNLQLLEVFTMAGATLSTGLQSRSEVSFHTVSFG